MFAGIAKYIIQPLGEMLATLVAQMFWSCVSFALDIINGIVKAFEWLAMDSWGKVLFGAENTDGGHIKFFPETSSPLFYIWIVMLSMGILMLIIFIAIWGIKKIKGNEGLIENGGVEQRGVGLKSMVIMVSLFFVPFALMTGLGLTRVITQIVFPTKQTSNTQIKNDVKTNFEGTLTEMANNLYSFPSDDSVSVMKIGDINDINENDGLYSHDKKNQALDTNWENWAKQAKNNGGKIKPFKNLKEIFERLKYEAMAFNKNALNYAPNDITDVSNGIISTLNEWEQKYGYGGTIDIEGIFKDLSTYASQAITTTKDDSIAKEIGEDKKIVGTFGEDTLKLLDTFHQFITLDMKLVFDKATTGIDLSGETIHDPNILSKLTDKDEVRDTEATISYINIKNLVFRYFANQGSNTTSGMGSTFWSLKNSETTGLLTSKDLKVFALESFAKRAYMLANGSYYGDGTDNVISLYELQSVYSTKTSIPLVILIYRCASGNKDSDITNSPDWSNWHKSIPQTFVGIMMVLTTIGILGQLIKRLVLRFAKIGWLWIMGSVIIPTSLTDGGGKLRVWMSMVVVELIMLFGLMGMWYIWKVLSQPLVDEVDKIPNISDISKGVVSFFAITGFLEIIIQASDWFAEIIGATETFGGVRNNVRGMKVARVMKDRMTGKWARTKVSNGVGRFNKFQAAKKFGLEGKVGIRGVAKSVGGGFGKVGRNVANMFRKGGGA